MVSHKIVATGIATFTAIAAAYALHRRRLAANARLPRLTFLETGLAVVRLSASEDLCERGLAIDTANFVQQDAEFFSVTRTDNETSVIMDERLAPPKDESCDVETGWLAIKLEGPLDFALVGILSRIATTLAKVGVSIFAVSTFDTDYVLIKRESKLAALQALTRVGYTFTDI